MLRNFLRGRYGIDTFSLIIFFFVFVFLRFKYLWLIGYVLLIYIGFRAFSKNISKRAREQERVNSFFRPVIRKIKFYITRYKQRKYYVYFKCQRCRNNLRLPRNKGRLQGKCPVCGLEFIMRT